MSKHETNGENHYGADNITVLKGLDAIRKRPGMSTGGHGHDRDPWEARKRERRV